VIGDHDELHADRIGMADLDLTKRSEACRLQVDIFAKEYSTPLVTR
jgi:hypothetical protein